MILCSVLSRTGLWIRWRWASRYMWHEANRCPPPLPSPVSGGGEPQPFGSGAQVARYVLTEEAYGVVEALWRHQATHVGFHKEPRKTQLILELLQTVGDSIRRPIDQAVLERRLVCEVGQVLGPLGAQFTTKSAGGLQQTLSYTVVIAHRTFPRLGESSLLLLRDVDAHTQHH